MYFATAESLAYQHARAQALAALECKDNIAPMVTLELLPSATATVTAVSRCPFDDNGNPQKGETLLVTKSFSAEDYHTAEVNALIAAYAEGAANLVCTPNVPPQVLILTESDLFYRCPVPYRNNNWYRSAKTRSADFTYWATTTQSASCPAGTYGPGAYVSVRASSHISYEDAEAKAILQARGKAQAQLECTSYIGPILIRTFNANAQFENPGDAQVMGIFRLTHGTLTQPERAVLLGVYTLPLVYADRYNDNFIDLADYSDVETGNWNYYFYLGRPHADGSHVWIPNSVQLTIDSTVGLGGAEISSLAANPSAGILSATQGVISITRLEELTLQVSFADSPYLAIDVSGYDELDMLRPGIYIFQTDPELKNVLAHGYLDLTGYWPDIETEKTVLPFPFLPVFADRTTPISFVLYFATPDGSTFGYTLDEGWPVAPPNTSIPVTTDYSRVAWTKSDPPFSVGSIPTALTLNMPDGDPITLPTSGENIINFTSVLDCKLIIRRYRQLL
jgi:hypothetical protein